MKHSATLQTRCNAPADTPSAAVTLSRLCKYVFNVLLTAIFLFILLLAGCGNDYNPRLPDYLKAEKELRSRVTPEQGLDDSINMLVKKFNIIPEKQIAGLKDRPNVWLSLMDELLDKKIQDRDKNSGKREKK